MKRGWGEEGGGSQICPQNVLRWAALNKVSWIKYFEISYPNLMWVSRASILPNSKSASLSHVYSTTYILGVLKLFIMGPFGI